MEEEGIGGYGQGLWATQDASSGLFVGVCAVMTVAGP